MAQAAGNRRERRRKTWSSLGDLGRKPTEYEVVTHGMNHTAGETPLEMGPDVHGNVWLKKYRDDIALKVDNWDEFRDPDQLTYGKYVRLQDEQEAYVDNLLEEYTERRPSDETLSSAALACLGSCLTPGRYLVHGQQMMAAYIQQIAASSYVANGASFQAADQLRRVQRIAYRTKQLDLAHPTHGFGSNERGIWESDPLWQPMREATERLLVTFAWDEALIATNLVVKPICDDIFLRQFARVARSLDAGLDALIADNLYRDTERHQRFATAACRHAIAADRANRDVIWGHVEAWQEAGEAIVVAGAKLVAQHADGMVAGEVEAELRSAWQQLQRDAGLTHDA